VSTTDTEEVYKNVFLSPENDNEFAYNYALMLLGYYA